MIIDSTEIEPVKMAAINLGSYYQKIVYVETKPSLPSGKYSYKNLDEILASRKYFTEEFALFGEHIVSRDEYDDGAAIINGVPVDLERRAQLRVRLLTPWNFFVAPHGSPLNNQKFDRDRAMFLDGLLDGSQTLEDFVRAFQQLPKRPW